MKLFEKIRQKEKRMPLKRTYYRMLILLIDVPILLIFIVALLILNQQFKQKSVENIKQMQQTLITQISSDVDNLSLRMTSMIYANNYEVLSYAAGTDTDDILEKAANRERLNNIENLYLEPNKEVMSFYFLMKDGSYTYMKNYIANDKERFTDTEWYQNAQKNPNQVYIGGYDTKENGDLFVGGKGDMLILIGVLAPDINTDRSGKIEMVELYQSSKVADQIKEYNRKYQNGKNRLGITHIVDSNNEVLFTTVDETEMAGEWEKGYTCIRTPVKIYDNTWYIESYVKTGQLTEEFLHISIWLFLVAIVLFLLITYYSSYFIRRIVKPIESVNQGLKEVEDGKLDVHIEPSGQYEIRNMIHQFNAMVRRLREMFKEYEAKIATGKNFTYYFRELMADRLTVSEVEKENKGFFQESFLLLGVYTNTKTDKIEKVESIFEHHAKYASRCTFYKENASCIYLSYRITESDYEEGLHRMIREIQRNVEQELNLRLFFVTGKPINGPEQFEKEKGAVKEKLSFRFLMKEDDILDERVMAEENLAEILSESTKYEALSNALFMADEKNVISEREKLFETYRMSEPEKLRREVYSIILAIGKRAEQNETSLLAVFGQQYNYLDKVGRIEDTRGIRLWLTNFINWILDYSASHLDLKETDVVALAKRYISEQYENSDLTLKDVADHVGLNDKYFSNRFTKEAGETMSEYLTAVRLQKAKELLRTTNFKVYEIAEMVGYHTLENFNRMFKKNMQISPTEYRKSNNAEK